MPLINYSNLFSILGNMHSGLPTLFGSTMALPPLFVQIEVTHRCNADCPMCYQNIKINSESEMTLEEIKHVIDQVPPWCVLSLTGGEPFIRNDFTSILEYGLKKRKCTVLTNASLVTDDHIEIMVRNGLLLLAVSVDGIGATHNGIRNRAGLFEKAVATIQKIQQKKKELHTTFPLIDIKTVILKENLNQLTDILALADSLSVDFITYSVQKVMDNQYCAPYRKDFAEISQALPAYPQLDDNELACLKNQVSRIRGYAGNTKVRFYPANMQTEIALEKFYRQKLSQHSFQACLLPWSRMSISPQGDVYPCLSYHVGNILKESLSEIWNGARFRNFRKQLDHKSLSNFCLGCCNSVCKNKID